jgi:hypothetical protein
MYITADGDEAVKYSNIETVDVDTTDEEDHLSDVAATEGLRVGVNSAGATATGTEEKVESWDVKKVGKIITDDTPHEGRYLLLDYLTKVEREIATETAARKDDIEKLRIQMAKNRAYNAKARSAMKKELLARMAVNAKKAKDDLDEQMRITAKNFAAAKALENKRWRKNNKRFKKTRAIMKRNKRQAAHELKMATLNQQRALSALDAETNAKIKATQHNIAKNAADIKANAIKAREDLDHACDNFDKKMYAVTTEAADARSKLAQEAKAMDKKVRAMVNMKVKKATKAAAKSFQKVRATMAADRHHADMMLAQTSTKMKAALATQAALQDERFKQTVADIAATKKEANDKVDAFKKDFKTQIIQLSATVKEHVGKLNDRQAQLQGVVTSNKLEQAKINDQVSKEITDMIKVGNDRETKLAENQQGLKDLMAKNKADTEKQMDDMSKSFYAAITKIRAQAKKDRAFAEKALAKKTQGLFTTLEKNKAAQDAVNKELSAATKAAADAAERALDDAKHHFSNKLGALHTTVDQNAKKADKKIASLTGVVAENAVKDATGRRQLKALSESNKLEMKKAVRDAVAAGEKRARAIEKMAGDMNKKTRDAMNQRITTEIGDLTKKIHADVEGLQLQTKEARAAMKGQVLHALRDATTIMKQDLENAVKWANKEIASLHENLDAEKATGDAAREAFKTDIDAAKANAQTALENAVKNQADALMALRTETQESIKKTNTKVTAYADAIVKHEEEVKAQMAANVAAITGQLAAAKKATQKAHSEIEEKSMARHALALDTITAGIEEGKKKVDSKMDAVYGKMAEDKKHADEALAGATHTLNAAIAKHAALQDSRFEKTVKDIAAAKQAAQEDVEAARKDFKMGLADVNSVLKSTETRVQDQIAIVAGRIRDTHAEQKVINEEVKIQQERLVNLSNEQFSESKRARGAIKELMDKNKVIAAQEIADLRTDANSKLTALRAKQAQLSTDYAQELTAATTGLYAKLKQDKIEQVSAIEGLTKDLGVAKVSTSQQIKELEEDFKVAFTDLSGVVSSNHASYERGMEEITGVVFDYKAAADTDRALIREEQRVMNNDLNKRISHAIMLGEAKAKEVLETASANIDAMKRALVSDIGQKVEHMANTVLDAVLEDRQTIANNYLSLKGYAGAAQDKIIDYVQKGQGKGLGSIGDLLQAMAISADIKTEPALGLSAGAGEIMPAFGGSIVADVADLSKVNGLADEYFKVKQVVDGAYPYGLGKYLLGKFSEAMAKGGVLTVGKKGDNAGQWVMINSEAVGLSSSMEAFEDIAIRVHHYQDFLAKITAYVPEISTVATGHPEPPFFAPKFDTESGAWGGK